MISFKENSRHPAPSRAQIDVLQRFYKFTFPDDYIDFLNSYNGIKPDGMCVFDASANRSDAQVLERFLPIINDIDLDDADDSMYDIGVVMTQIEERLISNPDTDEQIVRVPIALLFAGNYVCLDFSTTPASICIWDHEQSDVFSPHTIKIADNFTEFLNMLRIEK